MSLLPHNLTKFTSPIIDKAMKTGARSETTTSTNYGSIGDAFMKKAQLDLNMADLRANTEIKKAELTRGLALDQANIGYIKSMGEVSMVQARAEADKIKNANKAGGMEKILGAVGGAVSGAATGLAVSGGNPIGAVVGGVVGGAATYMSYEDGGRTAGMQAQQTLGVVSNAATTMRTAWDAKKAQSNLGAILKTGQQLQAGMQTAQTEFGATSPEYAAAQQKYQQFQSTGLATAISSGANPQTAVDVFTYQNKVFAQGVHDPDFKQRSAAQYQAKLVDMKSNPQNYATQDQQKAAVAELSDLHKQFMGPTDVYTQDDAQNAINMIPSTNQKSIANTSNGVAAMPAQASQSGGNGTTIAPRAPAQAPTIVAPQASRTVQQPAAAQQPSPTVYNGPMAAPSTRQTPGVVMERPQAPAQAEQALAKQGGETVKALGKEKGLWDRLTTPYTKEELSPAL